MIRDEILKKIQAEGLAILKLHEKLNEINVEHEFIDRKLEKDKGLKFKNYICPFDYQIYVEEDDKKISLIQNGFSYGITENLIEAYNFEQEPVVLDHEIAAALIYGKKLNSYIIAVNEKTDESIKKIFDDLNNLCDTNPFGDSRFGG